MAAWQTNVWKAAMELKSTIFSPLIELLPKRDFRRCVERHEGNRNTRTFSCWDQFLCMAFAQLTYRESFRDIEACLRGMDVKLYHLGVRGRVSRSTLAGANDKRSWHIFADFAQILIKEARSLYVSDPFDLELTNAVYVVRESMGRRIRIAFIHRCQSSDR